MARDSESKRYDACTPREGRDKTYWHRVGTFFVGEKDGKERMTLYLDSYPTPDKDGRVVIMMFEPKPRESEDEGTRRGGSASRGRSGGRTSSRRSDPDDEIPF